MVTFKKGWYSDTKNNLVAFGLNDFYIYDKCKNEIIYKEESIMKGRIGRICEIAISKDATLIGIFSWYGKSIFYAYSNCAVQKIFEHDHKRKRLYDESGCATFLNYFFCFTYTEENDYTYYRDYKLAIINPLKKEIKYNDDYPKKASESYDFKKRIILGIAAFDVYFKNDEIIAINEILRRNSKKLRKTDWFIACDDDLLYGIETTRQGEYYLHSYNVELKKYQQLLKFPEELICYKIFKNHHIQNELDNHELFLCFYKKVKDENNIKNALNFFSDSMMYIVENMTDPKKASRKLNDLFKVTKSVPEEIRLYKCNLKTGDFSLEKTIKSFPDYEKQDCPFLYDESSYSEDFAVFANMNNSVSIIDLNNDK